MGSAVDEPHDSGERWPAPTQPPSHMYPEPGTRLLYKPPDPINHPPHYTFGKYEVIDVIEDWGLSFHLAQVLKYVARSKHKGKELEDLRKARWFLDRLIGQLEGK